MPGLSAENIAYGKLEPIEVLMSCIIDDGIPSRGHRKNVFNPHFTKFSCFHGPHYRFKRQTVINFAQVYHSKVDHPPMLNTEELDRFV